MYKYMFYVLYGNFEINVIMFILFYLKLYKYVFWNKRDEKDVRFVVVFYLKYYFVIIWKLDKYIELY